MKFDWDYVWSAVMAMGILLSAQGWEPKWQMFGYFCAGAIFLRANAVSIVTAIREKK